MKTRINLNEQPTIELTLWGDPKAQMRPRTFTRPGAKFSTTWSPKENLKLAITQIQEQMNTKYRDVKLTGPVKFTATFYMKRPKGHTTKKGKQSSSWLPYPITKPDYDNLVKGVQDALNSFALGDDSAIVDAHIFKRYADDWVPCSVLTLEAIADQ